MSEAKPDLELIIENTQELMGALVNKKPDTVDGTAALLHQTISNAVVLTEQAGMTLALTGPEKKAVVKQAVERLALHYGGLIRLPFWLRPFKSLIVGLILDYVVDAAIDWIVAVYNKQGVFKHRQTEPGAVV